VQLTNIFRYPIKGMAPENLPFADLKTGQPLAGDRKFALAHKASDFDPSDPTWVKRNNFVVVALTPKLATIASRYDETSGVISVTDHDGTDHHFNVSDPEDMTRFGSLIESYGGAMQPAPYMLAHIPGGNLADRNTQTLSLQGKASLDAVSASSGIAVSQRRWRGNLWCDGLSAWEEFSWIGKEISIGTVRLEVTERIERCAATSANTSTGERDINMPSHLFTTYGHRDFGVLCNVVTNGRIAPGDKIQLHN
jgi:hypothetical protein